MSSRFVNHVPQRYGIPVSRQTHDAQWLVVLATRKMQVEMSDAERGSCFRVIGLQGELELWPDGWRDGVS